MTDDETIRAFVAVWPSPEIVSLLGSALSEFKKRLPGYRWVEPQNLHITLEFLGNVPRRGLPPITGVLDDIASKVAPFELALGGPGTFGPREKARVLWVEVSDPEGKLSHLAGAVVDGLKALGFSPDKDFVAHLTLARKRAGSGGFVSSAGWQSLWNEKLKNLVKPTCRTGEMGEEATWVVSSLTLVKSTLTPAGSLYDIVHESRFAPVVR
ncbi:MAG: RNA 2',3'-cyclic phosphodiesterase [Firmicutes bacterium]|nr:RNA 2',3'-cyclic phosphodiesterase [Candidatus Fermentithermobacillaceae bacterium]